MQNLPIDIINTIIQFDNKLILSLYDINNIKLLPFNLKNIELIYECIRQKKNNIFKYLLKDLKSVSRNEYDLIYELAIVYNNCDIVEYIISFIDVNSIENQHALHIAISNGYRDIIYIIIDNGLHITSDIIEDAFYSNLPDIVNYLIKCS